MTQTETPAEILLVDDDIGDVRLTIEALKRCRVQSRMNRARDGIEALDYLRRRGRFAEAIMPDLILLDLNMPRMDGRELLKIMKEDSQFKHIPVIVLTTSARDEDILRSYQLHANCYVTKPLGLRELTETVRSLDHFWFTVVQRPPHK